MRTKAFLLALFSFGFANLAFAQQWQIGQEREVDEGHYFKLLKIESGWRLWQIETKEGISCKAIKSARGRPHPQPLGVGSAFFGGTPFLTISSNGRGQTWFMWQGQHLGTKGTKFREPTDRFWQDWKYGTDLLPMDGKVIELNIVSYEYPEIFVGRSEQNVLFDLNGLSSIVTEVVDCVAKKK
jgi:hypothetical protein